MRPPVASLLALAVCAGWTCNLSAAQQAGPQTAWSGVYTAAQAANGRSEYDRSCSRCHASNLDGIQDATLLGDFAPRFSLRGADFIERWREDTVQSLYTLIASGMPPRNEPRGPIATLSDRAYLDIVAYVLERNGFPSGDRELSL